MKQREYLFLLCRLVSNKWLYQKHMILPDQTAKMALIALSHRSSSLGNVPLLCRLNLDQITFDMILRVLAQQGHL